MTRFGYVMTTYFSVLAIGGLAFVHVSPKLIWNASASAPTKKSQERKEAFCTLNERRRGV